MLAAHNSTTRMSIGCFFPIPAIGSIERLVCTARDQLIAGTLHGSFLQIHWPSSGTLEEDVEVDLDDEDATLNSPMRCRVLPLHKGPAEPCFCLLSTNQTLGRGFIHHLNRVLPKVPHSTDGRSYFRVSLFPDNVLSCDFYDWAVPFRPCIESWGTVKFEWPVCVSRPDLYVAIWCAKLNDLLMSSVNIFHFVMVGSFWWTNLFFPWFA